jgi:hypothetical protein
VFSRDIVLSLQRLPPGYRLVGAESVITVIGTAPRPAQEDELLPLATPGAPADRPRLRITTSSALRASLMIKDRVLTAPSGVRGGSCIERLRWGAVGDPAASRWRNDHLPNFISVSDRAFSAYCPGSFVASVCPASPTNDSRA